MNIQVIGANGMLGEAVCTAVIAAGFSLIADTTTDVTRVKPADIRGDVVINCAGLVKQRQVTDDRLVLVNGYGPQRLANACDTWHARLVQVSTDCVFHAPGPHNESDRPDARDMYAISKLAGEVSYPPHLTVRTSFVGFGGRRGLVHDLMTKPVVQASNNLLWSGHWVDTVAQALVMLAVKPAITGLLHLPGTYQSRLDLVTTLVAALHAKCLVERDDTFGADRRLRSSRWNLLGLPALPAFAVPVQEVAA